MKIFARILFVFALLITLVFLTLAVTFQVQIFNRDKLISEIEKETSSPDKTNRWDQLPPTEDELKLIAEKSMNGQTGMEKFSDAELKQIAEGNTVDTNEPDSNRIRGLISANDHSKYERNWVLLFSIVPLPLFAIIWIALNWIILGRIDRKSLNFFGS